jgi:hypothetical protein
LREEQTEIVPRAIEPWIASDRFAQRDLRVGQFARARERERGVERGICFRWIQLRRAPQHTGGFGGLADFVQDDSKRVVNAG